MQHSKLIGLYLLISHLFPSLKIGTASLNFHVSGNIPLFNEVRKIRRTDFDTVFAKFV